MIRVVNAKDFKPGNEKIIYVGRKSSYSRLKFKAIDLSILGNPFTTVEYSRKEAINKYKDRLKNQVKTASYVKQALKYIKDASKEHDIVLICWCKPHDCHADVIKQFVENKEE